MQAAKLPTIRAGERVFIVGASGSGKTIVAKVLMSMKRNVMIVDTKKVERWDGVALRISERKLGEVQSGRFYWPTSRAFIVDGRVQDAIFEAWLDAGHRVVYVDEAYDLIPGIGIKLVATQGRAHKLGLWVSTQRPSHIPLFLISEAQHFFVFYLRLKKDRQRVQDATGVVIDWDSLRRVKHSFVYIQENGTSSPVMKLDRSLVASVV